VSKRVAVVGAGPSGLVTVKELLDEGHRPTCFERASDLGGVFRFGETDGVVWESCRLTSSGFLTAFSDFPAPPNETDHLLAREYVAYLGRYRDRFGLAPHLRFGVTVAAVTRSAGADGWDVRTVDTSGRPSLARFDAVAICSGLHQHPVLPSYPGQDQFTGSIVHGSDYRRPDLVAGKRVLVVGAGESGGDIAAEVSTRASATVLSLRRGVAVLPRWIRGRPNDYYTSRINHSPAHWIFQTRNPADRWKLRVYQLAFFPLVLLDKLVQTGSTLAYEWLPLRDPRRWLRGPADRAELRTERAIRREIDRLLRESGGTLGEQFGTKRDDFVRAIAAGRCRRSPPIERFEGGHVVFTDGTRFEPDLVVFCTGFEGRIDFLDPALGQAARYLHLINPAVGPSLGFIGFLRPAYGAIPPLAELQARYFALLLSGARTLPGAAEMRDAIERQDRFRRHYFRAVRGRLDELVDFTSFSDELAACIGCRPTPSALRRESFRFRLRFQAGPFVSSQYRLVGPHAQPEIARRVIAGAPISHPPAMVALYYLRWSLSRALHWALGEAFVPKLPPPGESVPAR
jgi:dimethylaniline monooxygenase (N-oxide forming)